MSQCGPDCKCGSDLQKLDMDEAAFSELEAKSEGIFTAKTKNEPTPIKPVSSTIILRTGERFEIVNRSVSQLKKIRRSNGEIGLTLDDGQKVQIKGKEIKYIVPHES